MNAKQVKRLRRFIASAAKQNENVAANGYIETNKVNHVDRLVGEVPLGKEEVTALAEPKVLFTTSTKVNNPNSIRSVYQKLKRKRRLAPI